MRTPTAWAERWLWTLHVALCPLLFSVASLEAFEFPKSLLLRGTGIAWLALAAAGLAAWPGGRVGAAVLACLASALVSTALADAPLVSLLGADRRFSGLLAFGGYAALFAVARAAPSPAALAGAASAGAAGAALYAALQLAGLDPIRWQAPPVDRGVERVSGTLGNPNFLASYLAMALPLAVWLAARALRAGRRLRGLALAAAVAAAALVAVATLSRGGHLALALGLAATAAAAGRRGDRSVLRALRATAVALAVLVAAALATPYGRDVAQGAIARNLATWSHRDTGRAEFWSAALALFRQRPIAGHGPDGYGIAYPGVRSNWSLDPARSPSAAHNDWLQVAATQGALGLAAFALLALAAVSALRGARRRARDPDAAAWVAALAASLLAFAAQGLFSFMVIAVGSLFWVELGALAAAAEGAPRRAFAAPSRWRVAGAVLLALVSGAALVGAPAVADVRAARARAESGGARAPAAAALLERAVRADPLRPRLWSDLANAHHRAAPWARDPDTRLRHLARAAEANRIAIRLAPPDPLYHANLGRVLAELGADPARLDARREAFAALRRAAELAPTHPLVLIDAGKAALFVRASREADRYGARFAALYPAQAPGHALRGAAAMQREAWSEAESHLMRALGADWSRDPGGELAAWVNLARTRLELGDARGALEAAGRALVLSPGEPGAAALRARARAALGLEAPEGTEPPRGSAKRSDRG